MYDRLRGPQREPGEPDDVSAIKAAELTAGRAGVGGHLRSASSSGALPWRPATPGVTSPIETELREAPDHEAPTLTSAVPASRLDAPTLLDEAPVPRAGGAADDPTRRVSPGAHASAGGASNGREPYRLAAALGLYLLGVGLLVTTYAEGLTYRGYWLALVVGIAGILIAGLTCRSRPSTHAAALAGLGLLMWLPYYLRSPRRLIFTDELFHLQILEHLQSTGNLNIDATFYPIPGDYPGLEFTALTLHGATGVSTIATTRILTLTLHVLIPLLVYLAALALGRRPRLAFVVAIVYAANTSYGFFHDTFSYESLGIVFFLAIWGLLLSPSKPRRSNAEVVLLVLLIAGVTVTHHVSSYLMAGSIILYWLATLVWRRGRAERLGLPALAAVDFPVAWLQFEPRTLHYLRSTLGSRLSNPAKLGREIGNPASLINGNAAASRKGGGSGGAAPLPQFDHLMTMAYPIMVFLIIVVGVLVVWRRGTLRRSHRRGAALLALGLAGPLAWTTIAPLVATRAADVSLRAWPFLFLGVAIYVAAAIDWACNRLPRRFASGRRSGLIWSAPVLFLLLAGGISIGDNQAGRFPADQPSRAAGPEAATKDMVSAAEWLRNRGTGLRLVGDQQSQVVFSVFGDQVSPGWGSWIPFRDRTKKELDFYIDNTKTRFIVVDRRIATLRPRYVGYFGKAELAGWGNVNYGQPTFPVALLDKFSRAARLGLIYDNGNIRIYDANSNTRIGG